MNFPTRIARELFLHGPAGGKRVTSVKELVRLSGAGEKTIYTNLPQWKLESEELAANGSESGFALLLSSTALENHKNDVDFLRKEVDRLKKHLGSLDPSDEAYSTISRAMLSTERQWANMSGVVAALDAASAKLKETEKTKARIEAKREDAETSVPQRNSPGDFFARRRPAAKVECVDAENVSTDTPKRLHVAFAR